jgi:hypothetical protein
MTLCGKRGVTLVAQSNRRQGEALSEISDIIAQISDEDLERMESLAHYITRFDREAGKSILDLKSLLIRLDDDVEAALERLEPDLEEDIEDEEDDGEDVEDDDDEIAEVNELDDEDDEFSDGRRGPPTGRS